MKLKEAFAHCEVIAKNHCENFPVGSLFAPKDKKKYIYSIYAFARMADDFADEEKYEGKRLELLSGWEKKLEKCYEGKPDDLVFLALSETVKKHDLPIELFFDLIRAFKMDVEIKRYNNFEDVLFYCRHSANPVGRLMLLLFGYKDEKLHELSDHICTALQLANFWQDISVDLKKDRVYLPKNDIEKYGYSEIKLFEREYNRAFADLMKFEVDLTRSYFQKGKELYGLVKGSYGFELKLVWNGGMRILEKIEKQEYDVLSKRPHITGTDKGLILWRALTRYRKN